MREHFISKSSSNGLYKMIKFFNDTCVENNIAYWAVGGTLLGAIRHTGIIPWDDDGDFCITKKDVKKLRSLIPYFKEHGYKLTEGEKDDKGEETGKCGKVRDSCTWFLENANGKGLACDIFIMERIGNIITYADPMWKTAPNGGQRCFFYYDFVFPLKPMRFGNFFIYCPGNAIEHLNLCYGLDWSSHAQRLFDHQLGEWVNSKKRRMTKEDYVTIPPPKDTCEMTIREIPCTKSVKASKMTYSNASIEDLKYLAKIYKIKGFTKTSKENLIKTIKEHERSI